MWADLSETRLDKADLRGANLSEARLNRAILNKAIITGVTLWGTARDEWIIDGIRCNYVYWDALGEYRFPKDRDFRPGEFEELYKHLPTFEYYFEQGLTPLDPLIMDRVVQAINERQPEIELRLDSFHSRGQAHAVFTVLHKDNVEEALKAVTAGYEMRIKMLEEQKDEFKELLRKAVERPQIIGKLINVGRDYFESIDGNTQVITGKNNQ
jgi:uncharacterized protein YjbI with pentapeptide repeats